MSLRQAVCHAGIASTGVARVCALAPLLWLGALPLRAQDAGPAPSPEHAPAEDDEAADDDTPSEDDGEATDDPSGPPASDDARDADIFGAGSDAEDDTSPSTGDDARDADIFGAGSDAEDSDARDADIFGAGSDAEDDAAQESAAGSDRDQALLGEPGGETRFAEEVAPSDPLTIGGLMYLRAQSFILQGQDPEDWSLTAPMLAQLYFDVRPNDRVRGYTMVRLQYDPTLPSSASPTLGGGGAPLAPGGATDGTQTLNVASQARTRDVRFAIDQLWINFDIRYRAFVTVGKIHDRWGTGRFWMPTDFLHLTNRNPINIFDSRTGTNMLKVHVPVEALAWNFYGYAVIESPAEATNVLSRVGGALRGEFVLGTAELGLGMFARRGSKPRYAADLSFGVWDFDFYGEGALRDASEVDRVGYEPDEPIPAPGMPPTWQTPAETGLIQLQQAVDTRYPVEQESGMRAQAVGGVTYSRRYDDDDVFTLGAEYFYNGLGYGSPEFYPGLVLPHTMPLQNAATFFYLGRHYLAVFATLPSPFHLDLHTFTLSTLGNLSDGSYISRIDYAYTLLTHLRLEAFFAVHYGERNGEFRFGVDSFEVGEFGFSQPPSLIDLGLALRLEF